MYYFTSDYTEGAAPEIIAALQKTNLEQTGGYGEDVYCEKARELIKQECGRQDVAVHFMVGGTQTNANVICAALRPFQGVYGTVLSHINTHEAGAIERTGHKVIELPHVDGKLTAAIVEEAHTRYLKDPNGPHWVQPKMVYISQSTEIGSMYSKKELEELYAVCQKYGLYLFIDGARLGYSLCSPANDLTLADLARLCDVFYIGGTKCGALFGEAVVLVNPALQPDFFTLMKQGGAVLAKGRLLGLQFATLFTDGLYYQICQHAIDCALKIKAALQKKGCPLVADSPTNQIFVVLKNSELAKLSQDFVVAHNAYPDADHTEIRICTSWATNLEQVAKLIKIIESF